MADGKVHKLNEVLWLSSSSFYYYSLAQYMTRTMEIIGLEMMIFRWKMTTQNTLRYSYMTR